jgi:hypothetical protein
MPVNGLASAGIWLGHSGLYAVEPQQRDVDKPNVVEIDEQMPEWPIPVYCLEECATSVDVAETHETMLLNIDETSLICGHNATNVPYIPEQLVY